MANNKLPPHLQALHEEAIAMLTKLPGGNVWAPYALEALEDGTATVVPVIWGPTEGETFSHAIRIRWEQVPMSSGLLKDEEYNVLFAPFAKQNPTMVEHEADGYEAVEGWVIVAPVEDYEQF